MIGLSTRCKANAYQRLTPNPQLIYYFTYFLHWVWHSLNKPTNHRTWFLGPCSRYLLLLSEINDIYFHIHIMRIMLPELVHQKHMVSSQLLQLVHQRQQVWLQLPDLAATQSLPEKQGLRWNINYSEKEAASDRMLRLTWSPVHRPHFRVHSNKECRADFFDAVNNHRDYVKQKWFLYNN